MLLLDEPTAYLDPVTEGELIQAIAALAERKTIVIATHSPSVIASCKRVLRLEDGALVSDSAPSWLSGGERSRLCVARAILRRPSLLLLDEPTAGVDRPTAERILRSLRAYLPSSTIVVASHDPLSLKADVSLDLA